MSGCFIVSQEARSRGACGRIPCLTTALLPWEGCKSGAGAAVLRRGQGSDLGLAGEAGAQASALCWESMALGKLLGELG